MRRRQSTLPEKYSGRAMDEPISSEKCLGCSVFNSTTLEIDARRIKNEFKSRNNYLPFLTVNVTLDGSFSLVKKAIEDKFIGHRKG